MFQQVIEVQKLVEPKSILIALLFAFGSVVDFAQAAQSPVVPSPDELIHYGDLIDVDFVGGFEFDWRGTINPEGFLDGLDGYGEPIYALCRSESEIAREIEKAFSKVLRSPKVEVRIIDRSNRALARLEGGVKTPTRFRILRPVKLSELIVLAGGFVDSASGDITIYRPKNISCRPLSQLSQTPAPASDNEPPLLNIKLSELLSGDPFIVTGDMITVIQGTPVYVIGAVNNPKPVYFRSDLTVSRAVASAGGLSRDANGSRVTITRRDGADSRQITVDLDRIKAKAADDELLKPFDVIDVGGKRNNARKYPPAGESSNSTQKFRELPLRVVD